MEGALQIPCFQSHSLFSIAQAALRGCGARRSSVGMKKAAFAALVCLFDVYFYFIKRGGFTTPSFEIYFGEWNQWVAGYSLVLGA
jgi:hypothetical protein